MNDRLYIICLIVPPPPAYPSHPAHTTAERIRSKFVKFGNGHRGGGGGGGRREGEGGCKFGKCLSSFFGVGGGWGVGGKCLYCCGLHRFICCSFFIILVVSHHHACLLHGCALFVKPSSCHQFYFLSILVCASGICFSIFYLFSMFN